ncbi:hypothetical protein NDU88_004135, partial [Pleurodeles waltl]
GATLAQGAASRVPKTGNNNKKNKSLVSSGHSCCPIAMRSGSRNAQRDTGEKEKPFLFPGASLAPTPHPPGRGTHLFSRRRTVGKWLPVRRGSHNEVSARSHADVIMGGW